ncbi:MAG: phage portal protein [Collinsella sp.]
MFGFSTIKTKDLDRLRQEAKGYYSQSKTTDDYMRLIQAQLKGLDLGSISSFSRDQIKQAYETMAPVMAVVNYIADNVGEVSRYLELRDIRRDKFIDAHWILDLLDKPNDRFSRRKFFAAWAINKCLFADAFTYAPIEPGKDRRIAQMYVLPGQKVLVEKGGLEAPMKAIRLSGTNGSIDIKDNVFESFDYNLDDTSFYGTSRIAAAAVYLTVMDRAMNRQATTLKNGGVANIITPAASSQIPALPNQIDDMEQKLNRKANANKNIAMQTAIDVHPIGDHPADLSILQSHDKALQVLCFVYKLPVDIFLGQSKYENAKEAKKTVYEQIAIPMVNEFCEDFINYIGLQRDFELKVNNDDIEVLREKRSDVLDCMSKMHASLNELREANGFERIGEAWADQPILPMGVQFGNEAGFDISE